MRLGVEQQEIIKAAVKAQFGPNANVWLFGSRVNDEMRGGDIDLYIEVDRPLKELLQQELQLHAQLIKRLGDQRIVIVIHQTGTEPKTIHKQARETGVQL